MVLFFHMLMMKFVPDQEPAEECSRIREVGLAERKKMGSKAKLRRRYTIGSLFREKYYTRLIL